MSMSWTGKIKAALQGEVDGADALARLSVAASLAGLRQRLADRRLEVEIASVGEEWRVPDALAMAAAPLWAAEGLVTLAQALCDAEAEAHPDRPSAMAPILHGQVLALLAPMDTIQAEVGAVLADPARRPALTLPILATPYSPSGAGLMAERIPPPYLRGLLAGATSLVGAVQILAEDYTTLVRRPSAPSWLVNGYAVLGGDLAAAESRLDALQARAAPLLRTPASDEAALRALAIDCWQLINTLLRLGQLIAAPSLLPAAEPLPPPAPSPAVVAPPPAAPAQLQTPAAPSPPPSAPMPAPPRPASVQPAPTAAPAPAAPGPGSFAAPPPPATLPPRVGSPLPSSPSAPQAAAPAAQAASPMAGGRHVERAERWLLSSRGARHRLRAAGQEDQAERDLATFWDARGWALSGTESRYLDEVTTLAGRGLVVPSGRSLGVCPFAPIYRVSGGAIQVLGQPLRSGALFSYDYLPGGRGMLIDLPPEVGIADAS